MARRTKGQLWKFLASFTVIIGTITAIASLSTLNLTVALVAVVLIALLGIICGVYYFKVKDNGTFVGIPTPTGRGGRILEIREVSTEAQLREVADLDEEEYGEHTVNFQGLLDWWKRYPKGVYALFFNRKLIGAIGIWPLTKSAYERLVSGQLMESQLTRNDISLTAKKNEHVYWYFADIILAKKHRKRKLALYLPPDQLQDSKFKDENLSSYFLHRALKTWVTETRLAPTIKLCAIAVTPKGTSYLEEFGFAKTPNRTPDKQPIYTRVSPFQDVRQDIELVWGPIESPPNPSNH